MLMKAKARKPFMLLALAAISIGVAACGSTSSTDASKSTSTVKKEAGDFTIPVQLKVTNNRADTMKAYFDTTDTSGPFTVYLHKDESRTETGKNGLSGEITVGAAKADFSAFNPDFGRPYIRLGGTNYSLSEGDTLHPEINGVTFTLHRDDDTSVKVMQLTAG
jgi:hypothetical protein